MTTKNANTIRTNFVQKLYNLFVTQEEDCGMITSGSFNFPVVAEDGEEGWVEIVVKVPKGTKTDEYDGYELREDYLVKLQNAAERAEKQRKKAEQAAAKKNK